MLPCEAGGVCGGVGERPITKGDRLTGDSGQIASATDGFQAVLNISCESGAAHEHTRPLCWTPPGPDEGQSGAAATTSEACWLTQ